MHETALFWSLLNKTVWKLKLWKWYKVYWPFQSKEWFASNFSLHCYPWIKHSGDQSKGNHHQLRRLLIVKLILLVSSLSAPHKYLENSMENINSELKKATKNDFPKILSRTTSSTLLLPRSHQWFSLHLPFNSYDVCVENLILDHLIIS